MTQLDPRVTESRTRGQGHKVMIMIFNLMPCFGNGNGNINSYKYFELLKKMFQIFVLLFLFLFLWHGLLNPTIMFCRFFETRRLVGLVNSLNYVYILVKEYEI